MEIDMTDKKSSESRRKLLKSIAAGSGAIVAGKSLPESWSRPVVDSVMLPAHAQISMRIFGANNAPISDIGSIFQSESDSMLARLFDSAIKGLIPAAEAGGIGIPDISDPTNYSSCATVNGSNLETWFQLYADTFLLADYTGTLPLSGQSSLSLTIYGESCDDTEKQNIPVKVTDNGDSVTVTGIGDVEGSVTLPIISECPMKVACERPAPEPD
jgi:hypothetical protein